MSVCVSICGFPAPARAHGAPPLPLPAHAHAHSIDQVRLTLEYAKALASEEGLVTALRAAAAEKLGFTSDSDAFEAALDEAVLESVDDDGEPLYGAHGVDAVFCVTTRDVLFKALTRLIKAAWVTIVAPPGEGGD